MKMPMYFALFILLGCNSAPKNKLIAKWDFISKDMPKGSNVDPGLINVETIFENDPYAETFLRLYDDSTYCTNILKTYSVGHWEANAGQTEISLTSIDGKKGLLAYKEMPENILKIFRVVYADSEYVTKRMRPLLFEKSKDLMKEKDPYLLANLQWMSKPTKPLTPKALHEKLLAHINFLRYGLQSGIKSNLYFKKMRYCPTPFLFGRNGVAILRFENHSDEWLQLFYDRDEAWTAKNIYGSLFDEESIKMPENSESSMDLHLQILDQMKEVLEKKMKLL
jgi:hypothetical protein